jgi:DNA helicase HerA-like ATPase
MPFIEAPTTFYLGRRYDPDSHRLTDDVVYYDSRDLTTHAIVVGMTGSGKTGLCITMLEEAILDNIPAIIIDPKGDITNLLLTFPDMRPEDFQPWINTDDAARAGLDVPSFAADVARRWRDGLSSWGIVPDRLRWLKGIAQYSIYTPGSDAGLPISILASLAAPREGWAGYEETHREKINGIVTALLGLIGLNVEPVKDKEHVLVANIFEYNWQRGVDLTLEDIILQVQKPPFAKLGVFSVDDYMSEKTRAKLSMALNNIIAAPSFQSWIQGEPLNIHSLLYQPDGRARVSIFYIAHLSEAERQFIVTLLLENLQGWMRAQSGTTSLRALLYIDEMFGYFPPYPKNPPTKEPILRMLKQARAFGLGLILATQNPGDLDYKGLANAGTWFIGRLQSENDRARVMSGLESLASASSTMNLKDVERLVADIDPRVFLMHNVHDNAGPVLVHSRWAMSYLRGPLTRQQIQILMAAQKAEILAKYAAHPTPSAFSGQGINMPPMPPGLAAPPSSLPGFNAPPNLPETFSAQAAPPLPPMPPDAFQQGFSQQPTVPPSQVNFSPPQNSQATARGPQTPPGYSVNQPPMPSNLSQYFLPASMTSQQAISAYEQQTRLASSSYGGASLAYRPVLLAQAAVRYQDRKTQLYNAFTYAFQIPTVEKSGLVHWEEFAVEPIDTKRVSGEPFGTAIYGDLSPGMTDAKRLTALRGELIDMLYNTAHLKIPYNPTLDIYGKPGGQISEFRAQTQQLAREQRDKEADALAAKYEKLLDQIDEKIKRKERELSAEKKELADRKREELFTKGEAVVNLLKGRYTHTLSRTSVKHRLTRQTREDLSESEQVIAELEDQMEATQQKFENEVKLLNEKWAKVAVETQEYTITPFKKDIQVELFGIGWIPFYYVVLNGQPLLLPA